MTRARCLSSMFCQSLLAGLLLLTPLPSFACGTYQTCTLVTITDIRVMPEQLRPGESIEI